MLPRCALHIDSVPGLPRSVHVFFMRMRQTFEVSSGKAWDDSSRESRTLVGQYLARAPWSSQYALTVVVYLGWDCACDGASSMLSLLITSLL